VLTRRRIFRPARTSPRPWRGIVVAIALLLVGGLLTGIGLPTDLFGSAPREQNWSALAPEVRIVDGDTLRLGDRTLRLLGVAAPERGQNCRDAAGRSFDCGAAAAEQLARLVGGRSVVCRVQGHDRFGRGLGICQAGGAELNLGLVASGWALASADSVPALEPAEQEARLSGRGLWSGEITAPEAWRGRD
jgi:endonuclease YncB( thermonuclease family)